MKYQFIQAHSREYPITLMCRALEVSESGYHAWTQREVSKRAQEDQVLAEQVEHIFHEFTASAPNTKWVTDITAIETAEGDL